MLCAWERVQKIWIKAAFAARTREGFTKTARAILMAMFACYSESGEFRKAPDTAWPFRLL